jgi:pantoate--beta-alanine ligase
VGVGVRLPIARTIKELRATVRGWRRRGARIALAPTMGALHQGHLSLIKLARRHGDKVVVSVFVNPTQFGPNEDYTAYPRDEQGDWRKLAGAGAHLLYAPSVREMYPDNFSTRVEVAEISQGLCGASRPHHFAGVATVVAKLFLQCLPDVAVFGEKDYQQLLVIKRLASDLNFPIEVIGAPIVREADGLAMSSRNLYLSERERVIAPQLYHVLRDMAEDLAARRTVEETINAGRLRLEGAGFTVDYLEVRHSEKLFPLERILERNAPARIFAAVFLGKTRLIDNMPVGIPKFPEDNRRKVRS